MRKTLSKKKKKSSRSVSRILFPGMIRDFYHLSGRSTPRYRASSPQAPVYMIFQLIRRTACNVAITAGRLLPCLLTLASHSHGEGGPCQAMYGRLFSSPLLCPRGHLPFRKHDALCCPDFPPFTAISCIKGDRTIYCFLELIK
jgi:hypothetical protein